MPSDSHYSAPVAEPISLLRFRRRGTVIQVQHLLRACDQPRGSSTSDRRHQVKDLPKLRGRYLEGEPTGYGAGIRSAIARWTAGGTKAVAVTFPKFMLIVCQPAATGSLLTASRLSG